MQRIARAAVPAPADWAKRDNPSGTAPSDRLGTGAVGSGALVLHDDGTWQSANAATGGGQSAAQVAAIVKRDVKDFAETGSTAKVPSDDVGPVGSDATLTVHAAKTGESITDLQEFEAALRRDVAVFTNASWRQAAGNAATAITGAPALPAHNPDAELTLTLAAGSGFAGGTASFDLAALRAKPALRTGSDQLSTSNAVVVTIDGVNFALAHSGNVLRIAAADIGDYTASLSMSEIDVEAFARKSSTARLPAAKAAPIADGSIAKGKLAQPVQDAIDGAAAVDGISLSGRDVEFVSADARTTQTITLPREVPAPRTDDAGKFVAQNASGTAYEVVDAPSGGGGGLTASQVDARIRPSARASLASLTTQQQQAARNRIGAGPPSRPAPTKTFRTWRRSCSPTARATLPRPTTTPPPKSTSPSTPTPSARRISRPARRRGPSEPPRASSPATSSSSSPRRRRWSCSTAPTRGA